MESRKEIRFNYKVLAVAIPSRLILPSNITLVEQGIKCSPFGVSISNLGDIPVSRGFPGAGSTLKFTHARTHAATSRAGTLLARASGVAAEYKAAVAIGVGDQSAPGSGQHGFPPLPGAAAAGHALGLQTHHRRRGGLDYAPQRHSR